MIIITVMGNEGDSDGIPWFDNNDDEDEDENEDDEDDDEGGDQ